MKYLALLFAFAQANAMMMPMDGPGGYPRQQPMGPLFVPPPHHGFPSSLSTNSIKSSKSSPQIFMNIFQSDPTYSSNPSNVVQPEQLHRLQSELSRLEFEQMTNSNGIRQLQLENDRLRQQLRDQQQKPQNPPIPQMPGGCGCSANGPNPPCCTVSTPNTSPNSSGPVGHPDQMPGPPQVPTVVTGQAIPSSGPAQATPNQTFQLYSNTLPAHHLPQNSPTPSFGPKGPVQPTSPLQTPAVATPNQNAQLHWVTQPPPQHFGLQH